MDEGNLKKQFVTSVWLLTIVYLAMLSLAVLPLKNDHAISASTVHVKKVMPEVEMNYTNSRPEQLLHLSDDTTYLLYVNEFTP